MGSHQYWRLKINATEGNTDVRIANIGLYAATDGPNLAIAPSALTGYGTASSDLGAIWIVSNAFDNNPATNWGADGAFPKWIRFTNTTSRTFPSYTVVVSQAYLTYAPKSWTLEYSNNSGATWTVAHTVTNRSFSSVNLSYQYTLSTPIDAVDWRMNITEGWSPPYIVINEFKLDVVNLNTSASNMGVAGNAFDQSNTTIWTANIPSWISCRFGAGPQTIIQHTVTADTVNPQYAPMNWLIQSSDDSYEWETVAIVNSQTAWTSGESRTFIHANWPITIGKVMPCLSPHAMRSTGNEPLPFTAQTTLRNNAALQVAPMITGTVKQNSINVARIVRAYRRLDGAMLGQAMSDAVTGAFSINARGKSDACYVIAFDDLGVAPDYNAVIFDLVIPV